MIKANISSQLAEKLTVEQLAKMNLDAARKAVIEGDVKKLENIINNSLLKDDRTIERLKAITELCAAILSDIGANVIEAAKGKNAAKIGRKKHKKKPAQAPNENEIKTEEDAAKLELPENAKISDERGYAGIKRAFFIALREFFKSISPNFVARHYGRDGPTQADKETQSYKNRVKGDRLVKGFSIAGVLLGLAIPAALITGPFLFPLMILSAPISAFAFNILTHAFYNLSVERQSRLETEDTKSSPKSALKNRVSKFLSVLIIASGLFLAALFNASAQSDFIKTQHITLQGISNAAKTSQDLNAEVFQIAVENKETLVNDFRKFYKNADFHGIYCVSVQNPISWKDYNELPVKRQSLFNPHLRKNEIGLELSYGNAIITYAVNYATRQMEIIDKKQSSHKASDASISKERMKSQDGLSQDQKPQTFLQSPFNRDDKLMFESLEYLARKDGLNIGTFRDFQMAIDFFYLSEVQYIIDNIYAEMKENGVVFDKIPQILFMPGDTLQKPFFDSDNKTLLMPFSYLNDWDVLKYTIAGYSIYANNFDKIKNREMFLIENDFMVSLAQALVSPIKRPYKITDLNGKLHIVDMSLGAKLQTLKATIANKDKILNDFQRVTGDVNFNEIGYRIDTLSVYLQKQYYNNVEASQEDETVFELHYKNVAIFYAVNHKTGEISILTDTNKIAEGFIQGFKRIFHNPQQIDVDENPIVVEHFWNNEPLYLDIVTAQLDNETTEEKLREMFSDDEIKYLYIIKNKDSQGELEKAVRDLNKPILHRMFALMYLKANFKSNIDYDDLLKDFTEKLKEDMKEAGGFEKNLKITNNFELRTYLTGIHLIMASHFGETLQANDNMYLYSQVSKAYLTTSKKGYALARANFLF